MSSARRANAGFALISGGDRGLELAHLGAQRLGDRGEGLNDDGRRLMLALLLDPLLHVFQRFPGLNQTGELLTRAIVRLGAVVGKGLGEPGDRLGVDRIVLGQPAGRLGEMADPLRIDDPNRARPRAGFPPSCARNRRSPPSPPGRPGWRAATPPASLRPPECSAPTGAAPSNECRRRLCSLRHRGRQWGILPLPSLLVRALTPMQLFGLMEDAGPVPRFPAA